MVGPPANGARIWSDPCEVAQRLNADGPLVHGSLAVWGDAMGRPMDVDLHLLRAECEEETLVIRFAEGYVLRVVKPGIVITDVQRSSLRAPVLTIASAERVWLEDPSDHVPDAAALASRLSRRGGMKPVS